MDRRILEKIEKIVGKDGYSTDSAILYTYGFDASIYHNTPDVVIQPTTTQEVSEIKKIENKEKFKELYVANKDFALRMLAAVKAPPAQPVLNKSDARKPRDVFGPAVQNKLAQYREMPGGKEKDAFLAANAAELLRLEREEAKGK